MILTGLVSGFVYAADLPEHPKLHAAINAHLLTEKEKYFGAIPFRPMTPSEYRLELIDLNGDEVKEALVLMLGQYWGGTGGHAVYLSRH